MTDTRTVRVAAVQAASVVLDADASVDKAVRLLREAAGEGAQLVVLPECFLSVYPSYSWAVPHLADAAMAEVFRRFHDSAVEVPGPHVDRLVAACADTGVHCVIGVNEREPGRSSSVFNTMLTLGPTGVLARHRKLMPTFHERLFHAQGPGDDLAVVDTSAGRIGGLMCWENRMPLARYAVYRQVPQVYVTPTADDSDGWQALVRTIAIEAGAYVVSSIQYTTADAYPDDFPVPVPQDRPITRGGSCIVDIGGDHLAGPLYDTEGVLYADCDLGALQGAKTWFDVTGHYSREDALLPLLTAPRRPTAASDIVTSARGTSPKSDTEGHPSH